MRVILKTGLLVVIAESEAEKADLAAMEGTVDHVFHLQSVSEGGVRFFDLGARADACREPINVTSLSPDPDVAILGNFAPTPFTLDGRRYCSIESFWQGLKFAAESDRARIASLDGREAKTEGGAASQPASFVYEGEIIVAGTWQHWKLMERSCRAKFEQNADAASALLATGTRPLEHVVRRDSKTIPGVIMAQIWMRLREELRAKSLTLN